MITGFKWFAGFEPASSAGLSLTGTPNSTAVADAAVARTGTYYNRVFRTVASASATGGEKGFTSIGAGAELTMGGRAVFHIRPVVYPSVNDLRVCGWSGQRATRLEMNTAGQFRMYSDWISGFTTSYSSFALSLGAWYRVAVSFWHDRAGTDDTRARVEVRDASTGLLLAEHDVTTAFGGDLGTFNVDRLAWGNSPTGGPNATYEVLFDDFQALLLSAESSGAEVTTVKDLANGNGFFAQNKVFPLLVTGQGATNQFTGTYADVDEIPRSTADFQDGDNGEDVTYDHADAAVIGVTNIEAVKVLANAIITSGTQNEAILINGVAIDATMTTASGADDGATPAAFDFNPYTDVAFNTMEFGVRSRVVGQVVRLYNIVGEILGSAVPATEAVFQAGQSEIGLFWAEFTDRAGTKHVSSKVALPDPGTYFSGYKDDRVIHWSQVRRALSDRFGQFEGLTFGWRASDFDRKFRGLLGLTATKTFINRPAVIRAITDEGRRALLTPRTVARGLVRGYEIGSQLEFEFAGRDTLSVRFESSNKKDQIPQRLITVEDFPGFAVVAAPDPDEEFPEVAVPIIYGTMSDKNEVTVPGTAGLDKPTGLTATVVGGAGSASYTYGVTALDNRGNQYNCFPCRLDHSGETDAAYVTVTGAPQINEMSASRYVSLDWNAVANAHHYRIYGRAAGQTLGLNLLDGANALLSAGFEERYHDGERNGHVEIDIEKTDTHPPEFNNTRINPTTVDSGFGLVPVIYVGLRTLPNASVFHEFLVCGHAIKSIDAWYLDKVREANTTADTGGDYLIPGVGTGWSAIFGSPTYRDFNGHRYTVVYMKQDTKGNAVASGERKLTLNLKGIETVGDGSGALIENGLDQYLHCITNFVLQNYQVGTWLTIPTFDDDNTLPLIDESSFTTAKTIANARIPPNGYAGAHIIGNGGERISARDLIARFNTSFDVDSGFNRKCQWMISMINETVAALTSGVEIVDVTDIVGEQFDIDDQIDEMYNRLPYVFRRDYAGHEQGGWAEDGEVFNQAAIDELNEDKLADIFEFHMVRDPAVATDVITRRRDRVLTPPRLIKFQMPMSGSNFELGDPVRLTHYGGVSSIGWVQHAARVHRHELDPETHSVYLEVYDLQRFVDFIATKGSGAAGDMGIYGWPDFSLITAEAVERMDEVLDTMAVASACAGQAQLED